MALFGWNPMADVVVSSCFSATSVLVDEIVWKLLLNEDKEIITSRGGHQMTMAKQELQEIEKYMNHASIIIAGGIGDAELRSWLADAQLDAFRLEDQIAMYSTQDFDKYQLYSLKSAIGKMSIEKLTKNIQSHLKKMPIDLQIRAKLSEISRFTRYSNLVSADRVVGMEKEFKDVMDFLRSENDHQVLFIIGGQGSGKTTLIDKVYEDTYVKNQFSLRSRVNVSEARGLVGLLREVLEGSSVDPSAIDELEIIRKVYDTFNEENYLIVLDDVQDTGVLNSLMHVLNDPLPSFKQKGGRSSAWRAAFPDYTPPDDEFRNALISVCPNLPTDELDKMEDILDGIQEKCQGNPWNLCMMGTLLQEKSFHKKWREIMERMDGIIIHDNDTRRRHRRDRTIKLEDDKSPGDIRLAFLYCLAFPDSSEIPQNDGIPKKKLIRLWMAEGFLQDSPHQSQEQEAEDLLDELTKRGLLKKKEGHIDGKVKYTVNKDIQGLALRMCKLQKFCRFLSESEPDNGSESEASIPTTPSRRGDHFHPRRKRALPERYRMVAVHRDGSVDEALVALQDIRLRCLLYFRTQMEHQKFELSFNRKYKLLRTLELQGAHLDRLPSSIGYLICLRYLGLRGTQLEHLPSSCQRLKHLMCLDIRDTNITRLDSVSAFTEMRYLLLSNTFRDKSIHILEGLYLLSNLQTLAGAKHGPQSPRGLSFEQQLSYLQFIRKLSIKKVPSEVSKGICRQISKMEFLRSLTITCQGGQFDVTSLKIGKNLDKLKLGGDMGPLCDHRLSMMQSITYLYLWDSNLDIDPLSKLQGLQHLLVLSLCNASTSEKQDCTNGGYRRLRRLSIISMKNLIECTFHSGAMNCLEELVFAKCGKLKKPPANLSGFKNLKVVHLAQMHSDFSKGIEQESGRPIVQPHNIDMHFHTEGNQETAASPAATTAATQGIQNTAPDTTEGSQNTADEHIAAAATTQEAEIEPVITLRSLSQ
ncbi:disease resistance protein RPM1-like [Miscanthus floridulus]|uniref:disease resistance protein RPM1-like n=1 Tax=Miscanthus floridulus TaxID=154761 RepID=UPI003459B3F9